MKYSAALIIAFASWASAQCTEESDIYARQVVESDVVVETQYVTVTVNPNGQVYYAPASTTVSSSTVESSSSSSSSSSSAAASSASTTASTANFVASASSDSAWLAAYASPSTAFTDGAYDCSEFPSDQDGVVALDYLGWGGWSGIQTGDAAGTSCTGDGTLCSYACQPGMSKTQWPSDQPSDGQSRGGLICTNGKLYRTNTDTDYLCEWGEPSAVFVNELSDGVAVCRTDYPGSENMVIPTFVNGESYNLVSVVNEDTYYKWEGDLTSAQYYVNNAGVSQEDGCIWGTASANVGNYAPLNIGAGYTASDGFTWLSLFPNPQSSEELNFNVRIVANGDSVMNGDCSYVDGVYSGGSDGCTVCVTSGSASFIFSSD